MNGELEPNALYDAIEELLSIQKNLDSYKQNKIGINHPEVQDKIRDYNQKYTNIVDSLKKNPEKFAETLLGYHSLWKNKNKSEVTEAIKELRGEIKEGVAKKFEKFLQGLFDTK